MGGGGGPPKFVFTEIFVAKFVNPRTAPNERKVTAKNVHIYLKTNDFRLFYQFQDI